MNRKHQQSIYRAKVNVGLMEENVAQIIGVMTINVDVSVKDVMHVKKLVFGIQLHIIVNYNCRYYG